MDLNSRGYFTIRYYLRLLYLNHSYVQTHYDGGFPCYLIWKSLAPLEVSLFLFGKQCMGDILMCDSLHKRGRSSWIDVLCGKEMMQDKNKSNGWVKRFRKLEYFSIFYCFCRWFLKHI